MVHKYKSRMCGHAHLFLKMSAISFGKINYQENFGFIHVHSIPQECIQPTCKFKGLNRINTFT